MADRWIVNSHVLSRTAELFVSLKSNNAELSDLGLMSSIKRVRKHHALLRAQTYVSYHILCSEQHIYICNTSCSPILR